MTEYICRACTRVVDPDEEPSPGEPLRCSDCFGDIERELRNGLMGWGVEAS